MIAVVGYGNTLRRDDGAGVALVHRVSDGWPDAGVRFLTAHQLAPELAQELAELAPRAVVFVDARVPTDGETGQVRVQKIECDEHSPGLGHHLTPQVVVAYARFLFLADFEGWLLSLPGVDFEHGEGFSDRVELAQGETCLRTLLKDLETDAA